MDLETRPMTNVTYLSAPHMGSSARARVTPLQCPAPMLFDPAPVRSIYARLPLAEAEDLICRFLEDIAQRLDDLQRALACREYENVDRPARRVVLAASHLGLLDVVESAQHVRACLLQEDGIALHATTARLERAFDLAVNEVWNLRGI